MPPSMINQAATQSRLDNCIDSFESILSTADDKAGKNLESVTIENLEVFLGRLNKQASVVDVKALRPIIFIFDKVQTINASNHFSSRSLNSLFGVLKQTLAFSQNAFDSPVHGGDLLVTLAGSVQQLDDVMIMNVPVAHLYEVFVQMSCEILDFCTAFVSKASTIKQTIKRPINQYMMRNLFKDELNPSLTNMILHYHAYNSLLGRYTVPTAEIKQESNGKDEKQTKEAEKEKKAIAVEAWLDTMIPAKINATHISMQEARQKNLNKTGTWFIERVNKWLLSKESNVFWATGIPGAGKSVLMSTIIDRLASDGEILGLTGSAYFYFLYDTASSQKELGLYASLLRQLYRKDKTLRGSVDELYDRLTKDNLEAAANHLVKIFHDLKYDEGDDKPKFAIALDALDELPLASQKAVVDFIREINYEIFYVLVTARDSHEIKVPKGATFFNIQADAGDLDIYIRHSLASCSTILDYTESETSRNKKINEIVDILLRHASGMFLVTRYQVEHLLQCVNVGEMLRAAKNIKEEGVDNFHRRTYEQICKQKGERPETARRILSWIVFAKRALAEEEILEAVAVRDSETYIHEDDKLSIKMIVGLCRGLVVHEPSRGVVRLSHKTVQDYFLGELKDLHPAIVLDCFRYLRFTPSANDEDHHETDFNDDEDDGEEYENDYAETTINITDQSLEIRPFITEIPIDLADWSSETLPLTSYGNTWAMHHLQDLEEEEIPTDAVIKYLTTMPKGCFRPLMQGNNVYPHHFTPFHIVMLLGQPKVLRELFMEADALYPTLSMMDCQDSEGRTPLMWALRYGNTKMVDTILELGPKISMQDKVGHQALFYAASHPLTPALRILIKNSIPIQDETIANAVQAGNVPLVRALLEVGANPSALHANRNSLIHLAVPLHPVDIAGEMINLLLRWKTNINLQNASKQTALHLCSENDSAPALLALLTAKPLPDCNIQDLNGNSPVHIMANNWHLHTYKKLGRYSSLRRLDELNANVFLTNTQGDTPLHLAAASKSPGSFMRDLLVRAKLQMDKCPELDLNVRNIHRRTILQNAMESGDQSIMDMLLKDEKIDVDAKGSYDGHPLKWAVQRNLNGTVKEILAHSTANINVTCRYKNTALHDAAMGNNIDLIRILLEYHADATLLNIHHRTALVEAAKHNSFQALQILLQEQQRINAANNIEWNTDHNTWALLWAAQGGVRCLELLFEYYGYQINILGPRPTEDPQPGEEIDTQYGERLTPLHHAVIQMSPLSVKFLLERKANVNQLTSSGLSSLDIALQMSAPQIIDELIKYNALSSMPWDMDLLSFKWRQKDWYMKLQWQLTASERWHLAKENKAGAAWSRTTRCMTRLQTITQGSSDTPYIKVAIPELGDSPVKRIKFHIRSHDQGWGDDAEKFRGTYFNSYTWFEAGIEHKNGNVTEKRRLIQRNKYAIYEFQDHIIVWNHQDHTPGCISWLQSLQSGDNLLVYPKALYPGWQNTVASIKVDVFCEKSELASAPLQSPRVVLYHQKTHLATGYISLLPLIGTGITHLILGTIHVDSTSGKIHLNNHPPHVKLYDEMWNDVSILRASGVMILGMLGGAAKGTYSCLNKDDLTFEKNYLPLKMMIDSYKLQGLDLAVEEDMSLTGIVRLIDRLRIDFGLTFLITLAPVATALLSSNVSLAWLDYFALEKERAAEIAWYNVKFYNGFGHISNENMYNNILCMGWEPSKLVAITLAEQESVEETVHILREQHADFGGVGVWGCFEAGDEIPEKWVTEMAILMNRSVEEISEVTRRLALRWRDKAIASRMKKVSNTIVSRRTDFASVVLETLGGPKIQIVD